jgi:hypothetical protein
MNHSMVTLDVLCGGLLITASKSRPIRAMEEFGDRRKADRKVLGVGSRIAVAGSRQDKPTIEIRNAPKMINLAI